MVGWNGWRVIKKRNKLIHNVIWIEKKLFKPYLKKFNIFFKKENFLFKKNLNIVFLNNLSIDAPMDWLFEVIASINDRVRMKKRINSFHVVLRYREIFLKFLYISGRVHENKKVSSIFLVRIFWRRSGRVTVLLNTILTEALNCL